MLDEVTLDVIARIKEARLKEAGKSTANRFLALVRSILKRAVDEWDWLEKAPKVKLFKESEAVSVSLHRNRCKPFCVSCQHTSKTWCCSLCKQVCVEPTWSSSNGCKST